MALDWSETPNTPLVVDGTRLEYYALGPTPDAAPTIVMLHEGLGSAGLWRDFPKRVAEATGMGVFVYSRAGYGRSETVTLPRPLDFMTDEATRVLPQVLDAFGFKRGILFGHSDGATIAAIHAGSVEDFRVRGLILMAPHFFTEPMGLAAIAQAKTAYDSGELKEKLARHHDDVEAAFRGWNNVWLDPGFINWNVAEVIDYLRIPTLAMQGNDDQYGTLAHVEIIESRAYSPVDVVVLESCRHAPHQDQPDRVLAEVADFAARLERIEAAEVEIA